MSTRYSGKAFKDSSQMKTAKLSTKEKRKLKKKRNKNDIGAITGRIRTYYINTNY